MTYREKGVAWPKYVPPSLLLFFHLPRFIHVRFIPCLQLCSFFPRLLRLLRPLRRYLDDEAEITFSFRFYRSGSRADFLMFLLDGHFPIPSPLFLLITPGPASHPPSSAALRPGRPLSLRRGRRSLGGRPKGCPR